MPTLELSETEAKVLWLALDRESQVPWPSPQENGDEFWAAWDTLFWKAYRAYRGMPPERAA